MNFLSKFCLNLFEIINELYTAVGAGFIGIAVLVNHGYKTHQLVRTLSVVTITVGSLVYAFQTTRERRQPTKKDVVFITGCDSGLGFSLALHASQLGFTVIAGFLHMESIGALEIRRLRKDIKQIEVDVTRAESIHVAAETVQRLMEESHFELYALVNNAAVMVFGEFEWQTESLIQQQVAVNLTGTMNLTKSFMPLLRRHKSRLLLVTSHCSYAALPGLAVYGATKAGVRAFGDGLRVELAKFGVKVIQFTPGSFVAQSNIMSRHQDNIIQMHNGFTEEQHLLYDDYFHRYNAQLLALTPSKYPKKVVDRELYEAFEDAMLHEDPRWLYKVEPFRYAVYHMIFRFSPVPVRDYFIVKFMNMPEFNLANKAW